MTDQPHRATHYLKSWPQFFDAIVKGLKPFEVRKNDRAFRVGDRIVLYEWDRAAVQLREAEGYTGREVRGNITYIMDTTAFEGALGPEYVVLGIEWTDGIYPRVGM